MKEILNVYKPVGLTPLGVINKFKEENLEYKNVSMTYAGRLDPIAEGVLILLAGGAVYKKDDYLGLDKKYEADILLGIKTDTFDILGRASFFDKNFEIKQESINKLKGDLTLSLPPYSSFKVKGKALFWWEREGRINEIEIPQRKSKIYDINLLDSYKIKSDELLDVVVKKIDMVKGDFRQEEIKRQWHKLLSNGKTFDVIKIYVSCSSGTYIRSIADKIGGTLLHLKRTQVGDFSFQDSVVLW